MTLPTTARADLYSVQQKTVQNSSLQLVPPQNRDLSALEKELARIARETGYQNISALYKKFYAQSDDPKDFENILTK
jgi:hypothetical protein